MYRFRIDYYRNNEFFQDYVWANTESDAADFFKEEFYYDSIDDVVQVSF